MCIQIAIIPLAIVSPMVIYFVKMDPIHFFIQILFPVSPSLYFVFAAEIYRIVIILISVFEFMCFAFLISLLGVCYAHTVINCVQLLLKQPRRLILRTWQLYVQLGVVNKGIDFLQDILLY